MSKEEFLEKVRSKLKSNVATKPDIKENEPIENKGIINIKPIKIKESTTYK